LGLDQFYDTNIAQLKDLEQQTGAFVLFDVGDFKSVVEPFIKHKCPKIVPKLRSQTVWSEVTGDLSNSVSFSASYGGKELPVEVIQYNVISNELRFDNTSYQGNGNITIAYNIVITTDIQIWNELFNTTVCYVIMLVCSRLSV
jgi:hypothetical protein